MRKSLILFFLLSLIPVMIFSATGNVAGKVVDKASGKPLANVTIEIKGTNIVTFSKSNGSFYLKNVPVGKQEVMARMLGYQPETKSVDIQKDLTQNIKFVLERKALLLQGMKIAETRAVPRETPVAFTNVDKKQIQDKYATEDVPLLLDNVPGLFSSAEGLGDAELSMRGFEADKIQVLINGIPVNDPESQKVYWSNWTGLSSNIKSVQVQRGASSSLYGSGVIGGSINIETMGTDAKTNLTFRTSLVSFSSPDKVADGEGNKIDYSPFNYNVLLKFNSGNLFDGKFNFSAMVEKKYGDSYIIGTNYDGYSFGLETQSLFGNHSLNISFIGAPQHHNQARKTSDPYLFDTLGRNYNRDNHPYQENYYFKPQLSIRDEWEFSDNGSVVTNAFVTKGSGGGKYLYNSTFDVDTGKVGYQDIKKEVDQSNDLGRYAYYLWENYGFVMEGFTTPDSLGMGSYGKYTDPNGNPQFIGSGNSFFSAPAKYQYSFRANSRNEHVQFGINSYWQQKISQAFTLIAGYEFRHWKAKHYSLREKFRVNDYSKADNDSLTEQIAIVYDDTQRRYDYDSQVDNLSGFVRTKFNLMDKVHIMADAQYAIYTSKVDENPIRVFDYAYGRFTNYEFYLTKDIPKTDPITHEIIRDENGNPIKKYSDDDYKKTFKFFSPKFGVNVNLSDHFNVMFNTSLAHKEPRVTEWYNRYYGPDASQIYTEVVYDTLATGEVDTLKIEHFEELKPETAKTAEIGIGYTSSIFNINLNAYYTKYEDKIASTEDDLGHQLTINAGKAVHKGLEFSSTMKYFNIDGALSATLSSNKWGDMNFKKIFGIPADEVSEKHVPYSPERMLNASLGYTFENLPMNGKLRLGVNAKWWDNYWTWFTNEYEDYHANVAAADSIDYTSWTCYDKDGNEIHIVKDAKLPAYFNIGSSLKYNFKVSNQDVSMKLRFDNILSKDDNYTAAYYGADYNRFTTINDVKQYDVLRGKKYPYVTPAPLFNVSFTLEVKFQ